MMSAGCGVNFPSWFISPRNLRTALTSVPVGSGMSTIGSVGCTNPKEGACNIGFRFA